MAGAVQAFKMYERQEVAIELSSVYSTSGQLMSRASVILLVDGTWSVQRERELWVNREDCDFEGRDGRVFECVRHALHSDSQAQRV